MNGHAYILPSPRHPGASLSRALVVLAICALTALAAAAPAAAGLLILQRSQGIPGTAVGSEREYRLLVGDRRFKLSDTTQKDARSVIARLDKGVYWEVDPKLEEYREIEFAYYRMQRVEAEIDRDKARRDMLSKRDKGVITERDLEEWLTARGLLRDGGRQLSVTRTAFVERNGARQQLVTIALNGVTQVAVWQTDKYEGQYQPPKELFDFYDQMSLFPEDVSKALLREVKLFPLEVFADIDFFAKGAQITTKVTAVSGWTDDPAEFELPAGLRKVSEFSREKITRKEHRCPVCDKVVDPQTTPFHGKDPVTKEKVFLSSEECLIEFSINPTRKRP